MSQHFYDCAAYWFMYHLFWLTYIFTKTDEFVEFINDLKEKK